MTKLFYKIIAFFQNFLRGGEDNDVLDGSLSLRPKEVENVAAQRVPYEDGLEDNKRPLDKKKELLEIKSHSYYKLRDSISKYALEYLNKGNASFDNNDYLEAIKSYDKAIDFNPNLEEAYHQRGWAKYCLGDYWWAIDDYNKAIEINSKAEYSYNNRGVSKQKLNDVEGALEDYNKAIEINSYCLFGKRRNSSGARSL